MSTTLPQIQNLTINETAANQSPTLANTCAYCGSKKITIDAVHGHRCGGCGITFKHPILSATLASDCSMR